MSLADMFRANNMPVEQQVPLIQAPQFPNIDLSQFFSMMPRQQVQAPQQAAAAPAPQQALYEPGMSLSMSPMDPMGGQAAGGQGMGMATPATAPMQTQSFPSQAQMAARHLNSQAAGRLSGGK